MFGSLVVVVGVILLLFYLARRLRLRSSFHSTQVPEMRLLGTLNIAPKRALALVEFSDQWLIVGIGAESIRLITRMDRPPAAEGEDVPAQPKGKSFQDIFPMSGLLQQWKKPKRSRNDRASQ